MATEKLNTKCINQLLGHLISDFMNGSAINLKISLRRKIKTVQ